MFFLEPTNAHETKKLTGMINYHYYFISNFADIASPLFKLTEIKTKFKLTGEYQNAFDTLKSKLAFSPVMIYPYFNKPFRIHCDASGKAIGAVLSQMNNNVDCFG